MCSDGEKRKENGAKECYMAKKKMQVCVRYTEDRKGTSRPFVSTEEKVKTAPSLTCWPKMDLEEKGMSMRRRRRTTREHGLESLVIPLLPHPIRLLSSSCHL